MKRTRVTLLAGIIFLFASLCYAANYAGEFLNIGVGGRALGMGGAFTGLADDGTAAYWNPAGLGQLDRKELNLMYSPGVVPDAVAIGPQLGMDYHFLSYVHPLGNMRIGLSMVYMKIAGIEDTRDLEFNDADGNGVRDEGEMIYYDTNRITESTDIEYAGIFSFCYNFGPNLSIGGNVKQIAQSVFEYSSTGMGFDVGLHYRMNPRNQYTGEGGSGLSVGINVRDVLGTELAWTTNVNSAFYKDSGHIWASRLSPGSDTIPLSVKAGVAYRFKLPFTSETAIGFDFDTRYGMNMHAGLEAWFFDVFALRAGGTQIAGPETAVTSMSAGAGLKMGGITEINYAFVGLGTDTMGTAHRISMAVKF